MDADPPHAVEPASFVKDQPTKGLIVLVRICSRWLSWNGANLDCPFVHGTMEAANRAAEECRKHYKSLEKSATSRGSYEEIRIVELL